MKQDRNLLSQHGTKLMELKPSSIVQAAEADMKRRQFNADEAKFKSPCYQHYAFHRRHVLKAVDAHDLIVKAIEEPGIGEASGKFNTRMLYSDAFLLRQAAMLLAANA